jgi:hypothetical protein
MTSSTPEQGVSNSLLSQGNNEAELMPTTTSSDLFVGELFGDELIDIYSAAVQETVDRSPDNGEICRLYLAGKTLSID